MELQVRSLKEFNEESVEEEDEEEIISLNRQEKMDKKIDTKEDELISVLKNSQEMKMDRFIFNTKLKMEEIKELNKRHLNKMRFLIEEKQQKREMIFKKTKAKREMSDNKINMKRNKFLEQIFLNLKPNESLALSRYILLFTLSYLLVYCLVASYLLFSYFNNIFTYSLCYPTSFNIISSQNYDCFSFSFFKVLLLLGFVVYFFLHHLHPLVPISLIFIFIASRCLSLFFVLFPPLLILTGFYFFFRFLKIKIEEKMYLDFSSLCIKFPFSLKVVFLVSSIFGVFLSFLLSYFCFKDPNLFIC